MIEVIVLWLAGGLLLACVFKVIYGEGFWFALVYFLFWLAVIMLVVPWLVTGTFTLPS